MSFHHFPAEFVYWDQLENHKEIKKQLLPVILQKSKERKNNPFEACKLNTSLSRSNENNFLRSKDILENIIFKNIEKMLSKYTKIYNYNNNIKSSIVSGCWWNVYDEGDFQEEHSHWEPPINIENMTFYSTFSVIYILHDENEKSSIIFRKDPPLPLKKPFEEYGFSTSNVKEIREGTILIFPYNLRHLVKPCVKPGRVTVAYNVCSTFG
jgi:hypothetical protein